LPRVGKNKRERERKDWERVGGLALRLPPYQKSGLWGEDSIKGKRGRGKQGKECITDLKRLILGAKKDAKGLRDKREG